MPQWFATSLKSAGTRVTLSHPADSHQANISSVLGHLTAALSCCYYHTMFSVIKNKLMYRPTVGVLIVFGVLRSALPLPDSTTTRNAAIFSAIV